MSGEVRVAREGAVRVIVVDRPRQRNALAPATMQALAAALTAVAQDPEVRAVVLCGGSGRFIAGGDLRALGALDSAAEGAEMARTMQGVLSQLAALPVPTIAAIDRFAIGGGAEVALACDLRVACEDAYLAFRQIDFAVTTAWGGARRLTHLVGRARALDLLWSGRAVPAQEALSLGLVDRVAPAGDRARTAAVALAQTLAARDPAAVAGLKRLVDDADLPEAAHGALEAHIFGEQWGAPAHGAAVERFWARRQTPAPAPPPAPAGPRSGGVFIVFEGLDGAGTTTQAALLTQALTAYGRRVHQTHQPSAGPIGRLLRQALGGQLSERTGGRLAPRAVAGLFVADRADHLATEIEPALARGEDVICDRYVYSSLAYQGVECDPAWVAAMNAPMRRPDLVLYVRVPVEVCAARRAGRGEAAEIYEVDAFQRLVSDGYEAAVAAHPDQPLAIIDGTRSVEAVHADCLAAVVERLSLQPA